MKKITSLTVASMLILGLVSSLSADMYKKTAMSHDSTMMDNKMKKDEMMKKKSSDSMMDKKMSKKNMMKKESSNKSMMDQKM